MKNIQVIDGAVNCAYAVYQTDGKTFSLLFPNIGQDVEFIGDFVHRVGEEEAGKLLKPLWSNRVDKKEVKGIHGTLFFELENKRKFYPTKKESDLDRPGAANV